MIITEQIIKLLMAFGAGALLGVEREYHSKPAGFRTMILICVGSTLFSILSTFSTTPDRIASNIVTGVGFLGAGVVFKEGLNIRGITSAAIIWVTAAVGMAIGLGYYFAAGTATILILTVLVILSRIEETLDGLRQMKLYKISFIAGQYSTEQLDAALKQLNIVSSCTSITKQNNLVTVYYKVYISARIHDQLSQFLINTPAIQSFEV